jgi:hypothetical protein
MFPTESLGMVETQKKSLGNGEPLLQSRRLSCDASRKGSAWMSSSVMDDVKMKEETPKKAESCPWRNHHRKKKISMKRCSSSSNEKVIHIVSTKKAQFSHILPGDSCVHNSPIIYQPKRCEQSRREVATLWYHPFQAGN